MATPEQILAVRSLIGETTLTDEQIGNLIDGEGNVWGAVAAVWEQKAAETAHFVNISESGSSRSMGDAHKNALNMAAYYRKKIGGEDLDPNTPRRTTTRAIERA